LQVEFQRRLVRAAVATLASGLHPFAAVAEHSATSDRRTVGVDRRTHSRGGRRAGDPHANWRWRRLAWLFGAYAVYLSFRSLPATAKKHFTRAKTPSAG